MKRIVLIGALLMAGMIGLKAQSDMDAFRFSQIDWSGTARFVGAGGAFGAVGADYSALATNPASIGVFKKSEISVTPVVVTINNNTTTYNGESTLSRKTRYSVSNVGAIFALPNLSEKFVGLQFGFGYNRIYDFNGLSTATGMSGGSTMADAFLGVANGTTADKLSGDARLAFNTWVIDTCSGTTDRYWSEFEGRDVRQYKYRLTKGGNDEMNFSIGTNYCDKLFIGATIGVPFLSYEEISRYSEMDDNDEVEAFTSFDVNDKLTVSGTGINFKFGILYQPVAFMRIGAAIHTPTYYNNMKDYFYREMISNYDNGGNSGEFNYENAFRYSLSTPFRVMGNVAFLIQRRAFVSAEYEYVNYGMAHMQSDDYLFMEENANIQKKYGSSHIARIGAEVNVTQHFLLRAGYNFKSSPYKEQLNHGAVHIASAGFGLRGNHLFFDMAYQCKISKDSYWFYDSENVNEVYNRTLGHRIMATIGFKF